MPDESDIEEQIHQSVPTETIDYIRSRVPLEPSPQGDYPGDSQQIPNEQRQPRARYDPAYVLGSTATGSGSTDGSDGPWGGDAPAADLSIACTDTWHRDRPPNTVDGVRTWGVEWKEWRFYVAASGSGYEIIKGFQRKLTLDALGIPVKISAEVLTITETVSGTAAL